MKTIVIQIHNDFDTNADRILICESVDVAKVYFAKELEYRRESKAEISNLDEVTEDENGDVSGSFSWENADGSTTFVKVYDYHILEK